MYYESSNTLQHHGIMGMKWGVRRYQNEDGTFTTAGKKRYAKGEKKQAKIVKKKEKTQKQIEYSKQSIKSLAKQKRAMEAQKSRSELEKQQLDRKIALDDYWTKWGARRAQDKSFFLNATIKELDENLLANKAEITNYLTKLDVFNKKLSDLDRKYAKIGKKFMFQ